jgi:spoIIIJ-associated protein
MSPEKKKNFFSFFKGASKTYKTSEDEEQRKFALSKELHSDTEKDGSEQIEYSEEINEEIVTFCKNKLQEILDATGFQNSVLKTKIENNRLMIKIINDNDAGRIIGKDGAHLNAFQVLLRAFAYKKYLKPINVLLDIQDYRKRKMEILIAYAIRSAKHVEVNNQAINLEPMNAAERREVHMLFQDHKKINTVSNGVGKERHIVIEPIND